MTADAFSLLGGGVSASAVNQSSDCPESANGIGDRMTQRQGIYQDIYRGLKMAVLIGCPSVRSSDLGFRPPAPTFLSSHLGQL
jgi:hypothetical protein